MMAIIVFIALFTVVFVNCLALLGVYVSQTTIYTPRGGSHLHVLFRSAQAV